MIIPIYKSGNARELQNYRQNSLVSPIAKIKEKCAKIQLHGFIIDKKSYNKCQSIRFQR